MELVSIFMDVTAYVVRMCKACVKIFCVPSGFPLPSEARNQHDLHGMEAAQTVSIPQYADDAFWNAGILYGGVGNRKLV